MTVEGRLSYFIKMIRGSLVRIYSYRLALFRMAFAGLKAKYSNSLLGIFWAVINPLLIMSAVSFVFYAVFKVEIKEFPFFVLAGIFPWMFFSAALTEVTASILGQKSLLHQFSMPREIIPLSVVLANFFNFLIGWLVIYPLFLFFNPKIIMLLPLLCCLVLLHLVFLCGLGLLTAILNVFFHDIEHLLGVLLMFWFWVTPVFYSIEMVPQGLRWIFNLNPMSAYIVSYREILFQARVPAFSLFIAAFSWAAAALLLGLVIFSGLENKILKRI